MKDKSKETSQCLSFILRHSPESIGLQLDSQGWAVIDDFLHLAVQNGKFIEKMNLLMLLIQSTKKRFSISDDGIKIRALQCHSARTVDITFSEKILLSIYTMVQPLNFWNQLKKGLLPGSRHYVHLSENQSTAEKVGSRHGNP